MEQTRTSPEVRRLGILGGTFDPIHVGHLAAASEALHAFSLDRVTLVPAGRPWQKAGYSDAEDRLMMTTLAAATHLKLSVSRIELDRRGPTYSVDTLEAFRKRFPEAELFFIIGADAVADLATWHRVHDIAGLAEVIAVSRPGTGLRVAPGAGSWPHVHELEIPGIDISSTMIRERVAQGRPIDYLVPGEVVRFIRDHGLYLDPKVSKGA